MTGEDKVKKEMEKEEMKTERKMLRFRFREV